MPGLKLLRMTPFLLIGACSLADDETLHRLTLLSGHVTQLTSDYAFQSQRTPEQQLARANELIYQSMTGSSSGSSLTYNSPAQSSWGFEGAQSAIDNDSLDWNDEWQERDPANSGGTSSSMSQGTTLGSSSTNMSCEPRPPECEEMNQRAFRQLESMSNRPSASIHGASSEYYCMAFIGMHVNRVCSTVYRLGGQDECADLAEANALEYERVMPSALEAAGKSSIDNMRRMCEWEY